MILTLEVTASQDAKLPAASRQVFREDGGSIGRENASTWVLPQPKVSGLHALITCRNEVFYIEDRSRNGVFINSRSPTNRLAPGKPYALKSGDRLFIDPYEIYVQVTTEQSGGARGYAGEWAQDQSLDGLFGGSNPVDLDDPFMQGRSPSPAPVIPPYTPSPLEPPAEASAGQELDPLKLLGTGPKHAPARKLPRAKEPARGSPLHAHYQAPAVLPAPEPAPQSYASLIPHDYDPLAPDDEPSLLEPLRSTPAPNALPPEAPSKKEPLTPEPVALTPSSYEAMDQPALVDSPPAPSQAIPTGAGKRDACAPDLAAVLEGAGLQGVTVTPELARGFGRILRVVVTGVMDVLRARQQIKDEFRMHMTRFKVADNNPLKFSADVDDALHNLLVKRNAAYLGPVEAFEDAFDDLRDHQIAMLAGMRVAFESMLAQFDPDRLEEQFDRQLKRGSLLGMTARLRYWDLFRDRRQEMAKDPEASFRALFGEEFAQAYEEQLKRLKTQRPGSESTIAQQPADR